MNEGQTMRCFLNYLLGKSMAVVEARIDGLGRGGGEE